MDLRARLLVNAIGIVMVAAAMSAFSHLLDLAPGIPVGVVITANGLAILDLTRAGYDRPLWRWRRLETRFPPPRPPQPR